MHDFELFLVVLVTARVSGLETSEVSPLFGASEVCCMVTTLQSASHRVCREALARRHLSLKRIRSPVWCDALASVLRHYREAAAQDERGIIRVRHTDIPGLVAGSAVRGVDGHLDRRGS